MYFFFFLVMGRVGDGGGSHKITMEREDYFCLLLVSYCSYPGVAQHTARVFAVMLCQHPHSMVRCMKGQHSQLCALWSP